MPNYSNRNIPYSRQEVNDSDIDAVVSVLKSDWLTQGPMVPLFESMLAKACAASGAVVFNSATSALHAAYHALGVGPGDLVLMPANTFAATANAALFCGADVDFVDISLDDFNVDIHALEEKLIECKHNGRSPKVVTPVHFAGAPCNLSEIFRLSQIYGFAIVEDASHALGANFQGRPIGCGDFSDITIFSFHPVKMITTGEGGAAVTNKTLLKQRLKDFSSHGITKEQHRFVSSDMPEWYYEQLSIGYNYRMTEVSAALGHSQLKRLKEFVEKRNAAAKLYIEHLPEHIYHPRYSQQVNSSYHLFPVMISEASPYSRNEIYKVLKSNGIFSQVHYIPIYHHPYYKKIGFKDYYLPNTEKYFGRCLSLPLFPSISTNEIQYVCNVFEKHDGDFN